MIFAGTVIYLTSKKLSHEIKSKIINFFKEFQDYKKRLFILLASSSIIHPVIYSLKKNKILKISSFIKYKNTEFVRKCLR